MTFDYGSTTNHVFIPNTIVVTRIRVQFTFFVNSDLEKRPSYVTKSKGKITIHINSIEFYHILKRIINKYRSQLKKDTDLQCNFIAAWKSKQKLHNKTTHQSIPTEVKNLLSELKLSNPSNLFCVNQ